MLSPVYQFLGKKLRKQIDYLILYSSNPETWHFDLISSCSYNLNRSAFCHNYLDDSYSQVVGIYPKFTASITWVHKICFVCKLLHCWNECQSDVEFCWILSGEWCIIVFMLFSLLKEMDASYEVNFFNLWILRIRLQSWVWSQCHVSWK